jgi:arylformamidase
MMKIIDISVTLDNDLTIWPGDPAYHTERVHKIEDGANANVSIIEMGAHTGTHVDAPYHFLTDGGTVENLPLEAMLGPAQVIQIGDEAQVIDRKVLQAAHIPAETTRLLLKTRNSSFWQEKPRQFHPDFVGIDEDGANYLVETGVRLVGIDYLSISPYHKSRPTHEGLLKARVVIIEALNLAGVEPGKYNLACLPIKLGGVEGAPARVVLMD